MSASFFISAFGIIAGLVILISSLSIGEFSETLMLKAFGMLVFWGSVFFAIFSLKNAGKDCLFKKRF